MAPSHAISAVPMRRAYCSAKNPAVLFHKRRPATAGASWIPLPRILLFSFLEGTSESYENVSYLADGSDTTAWTDGCRGVDLVCRNLKRDPAKRVSGQVLVMVRD